MKYKSHFEHFKEEVENYLKNREEVSSFRITRHGEIFKVSLMLKVEHWMAFKLTNEIDFYKPIYQSYINNKPDYNTDVKIYIYCSKK